MDGNIEMGKEISPETLNSEEPSTSLASFSTEMMQQEQLMSPTTSTQTPLFLSSSTPRKERLKKKIKVLQRRNVRKNRKSKIQNWTLEDFFKLCDVYLSKPLAKIVKEQSLLKDKKPIARRYSAEFKQFALTLHFLGPRAYIFMKSFLSLPSERNLRYMTEKLVFKPGLANEKIFKALQMKINCMFEQDKHRILCVDEMSIKANLFYHIGRDEIIGLHDTGIKKENIIAQNVCVIMARGVFQNWKQPIAFFFVNTQIKASELVLILEECVSKLTQIGLFVHGLVTDMGSNFINLSNLLKVTPENPEFDLGPFKLLYLFDTCHLLKATKNNLAKHVFHFDDKKTSWSFVEYFYKEDKKQVYRLAPKLTDAHIHPSNFEKMLVKLAVQVLSRTVASGMHTYKTLGSLPADASATIEIFEKLNNLFDILNSLKRNCSNEYNNVFEGTETQISYLNEMFAFFSQVKVFTSGGQNITSKCKFLKGWLVSITSIQKLWEKLASVGFKYLRIRLINQDCLENYFGNIRQQGGSCVNPTPIQFERAHRILFCRNFLHSSAMNCCDDFSQLLTTIKSNNIQPFEDSPITHDTKCAISLPDTDYRSENIPTQNAFVYVCGYLIKKCLNVHSCPTCINFSQQTKIIDQTTLFLSFKTYDQNKGTFGGLRSPGESFLYYIYSLEKIFSTMFDDICTKTGISHIYLEKMKNVSFCHPCPDFPLLYVIKLFIRLKIFYSVKFANKDITSCKRGDMKNRKIQILSHL